MAAAFNSSGTSGSTLAQAHSTARIRISLAAELFAWMRENSKRGGYFAGDSHAVEATCQRLQDEQAFVQEQCAQHGIRYDPNAFWNLFRDLREQFSPNRRGRVWHPETLSDRKSIWVTLDVEQQKWMDRQCKDGPFESVSHLVETGLRHLRQLESAGQPMALRGVPFDAETTWRNYRKELAALDSAPRHRK